MKAVIEYIKDVKMHINEYYPKKWWKDKKYRRIRIHNALYVPAPARWKLYNRLVRRLFGKHAY